MGGGKEKWKHVAHLLLIHGKSEIARVSCLNQLKEPSYTHLSGKKTPILTWEYTYLGVTRLDLLLYMLRMAVKVFGKIQMYTQGLLNEESPVRLKWSGC